MILDSLSLAFDRCWSVTSCCSAQLQDSEFRSAYNRGWSPGPDLHGSPRVRRGSQSAPQAQIVSDPRPERKTHAELWDFDQFKCVHVACASIFNTCILELYGKQQKRIHGQMGNMLIDRYLPIQIDGQIDMCLCMRVKMYPDNCQKIQAKYGFC